MYLKYPFTVAKVTPSQVIKSVLLKDWTSASRVMPVRSCTFKMAKVLFVGQMIFIEPSFLYYEGLRVNLLHWITLP